MLGFSDGNMERNALVGILEAVIVTLYGLVGVGM